jgi:ubiquinone biosynthesis protein
MTPTREAATGPSLMRRYGDIARVLVRHGLADVVDALHLGSYLAWGTRVLPPRARMTTLSRAARIRLTLEELGPTFVKFGQALSVRSDLLPADLIAELAALQEHVAPLAPGVAESAIEAAFGQPVAALFATFETTPIASASIAQVHRAALPSGEIVAVKVRRPGIAGTIAADVEILRQLARLVQRHVPAADAVDPVRLVDEFARTIRSEQDLIREGRNLERCAADFAGDPTAHFPRVYWERTTSSVLTMEYLDGVKVTALDAAGIGPFARRLIARRGADAILRQVLEHGFFHADPHPGNLVVMADHVIGFLDLGMVGRLDDRARRALARIVHAIQHRDTAELTAVALEIMETRGEIDAAALERDLAALIELYGDVPLADLSVRDLLGDVVGTAARHRLRFPSPLMLLIKALVTIEGVGARLDPAFKMVEHAAPMAERLRRRELAPDAIASRVMQALTQTAAAVHAIPGHLDAIARKVRDGRLQVQFVHRNLDHFVHEMDRASNRIAFALIIAALIVGSSLIIHAGRGTTAYGYPVLGLIGFLVAAVFGVGLAIGIMRSGRL